MDFAIPETFLSPEIQRLFRVASTPASLDVDIDRFFLSSESCAIDEDRKCCADDKLNSSIDLQQHPQRAVSKHSPRLSLPAFEALFVSKGLCAPPPRGGDAFHHLSCDVDDLMEDGTRASVDERFEKTLAVLAPIIKETAKRWRKAKPETGELIFYGIK